MAPFPRQNGSERVGGNLRPRRDPLPFAEQIGDDPLDIGGLTLVDDRPDLPESGK